jgi:hypothetical protein
VLASAHPFPETAIAAAQQGRGGFLIGVAAFTLFFALGALGLWQRRRVAIAFGLFVPRDDWSRRIYEVVVLAFLILWTVFSGAMAVGILLYPLVTGSYP